MRLLVPVFVVALLAVCFAVSGLVVVLAEFWQVPRWVVGLIVWPLAGWLVVWAGMLPLRRKAVNELRALTTEELESRTLRYPVEYFRFIGENDPAVVRFKAIVEAQDLDALRREWRGLEKQFRRLEVKAGHRGRPLVMDHFHWMDLNAQVLSERRR